MKYYTQCVIALCVCSAGFFCGTIPTDSGNSGNGSLNLLVWINKSKGDINTPLTRETTWSKLVVRVSAPDMGAVLDTFPLSMASSFYSFTIADVSAGDNRLVQAWTIDNAGDTIHGITGVTVKIEPAKTAQAVLELNPVKGSIYAVLTEIPTIVDTVKLIFSTSTVTWQASAKREAKLNMCLDKVPFGATGTLSIVGYNAAKDTVASWKKENFTFTNSNMTINASFISVGKITIQVTLNYPGVTIIVGIMDTTDSLGDEKGGLLISEIMYAIEDSEYVEIYNPKADTFNDSIILQLDNGMFRRYKVKIPPYGFFVIGRKDLPWANTFHSTTSALDLTPTTGNWIMLSSVKDSSIYDIVAFQTGSNSQGWPNFSTTIKASIVLDSLPDNPEYNNFGRNWKKAVSFIDVLITQQLGTPGKAGS